MNQLIALVWTCLAFYSYTEGNELHMWGCLVIANINMLPTYFKRGE